MHKNIMAGVLCLSASVSFSQHADSSKSVNIDEVTVNASRTDANLKNIPQKIEVIDRETISSVPNENAAELLKRTTNLDIIQYPGMSATVGMRGFSPIAHARSYTLILINGKPSGTDNLASIDPAIIENIEVIKGPYSMLYGSDAMGGVINIITRQGADSLGGVASVSVGSYGSLGLAAEAHGPVSRKTAFAVGFSRQEQTRDFRIGANNLLSMNATEKLVLDKNSYGDLMLNSKYQAHQANGQVDHRFSDAWSSSSQLIYSFANGVETSGNYWGSYGQSKKDIDRVNVYQTVKRGTAMNTLVLSPYFTDEETANYSDNSDTGFVSFSSIVREYGVKVSDCQTIGRFKLLAGADVDVYDYSSRRFKGKSASTSPYNPDNKNIKSAVFAQLSLTSDRFDANAGLRYNYIMYQTLANESLNGSGGTDTYTVPTPSAGVQYKLLKNTKAHASVGTAFSVPDAFKMSGTYSVREYFPKWKYWYVKNYVGNPDLKPESSLTYDGGLNYSLPGGLLGVDATYFQTRHKDKIIEYTPGKDSSSYKNANNSVMKGVELMLTTNVAGFFTSKFRLEIYANLTYMLGNTVGETLKTKAGLDSTVTRDLLCSRKCNGNAGIAFDNKAGFSARIHARYVGTRLEKDNFAALRPGTATTDYYAQGGYTAKDKILKHPDYLIFDCSVSYTVRKARLGITVSNLFDENYSEKDGYNMPGRMLTGSLGYNF